ncbi:MAG: class I tRNA ligase family protein, partial [Eggerthellaceae bacterium]|nr:class I tRNA ligase family protein [Eggerthellaceae bacterium]
MTYTSEASWPKRAVVTAGMPYGNKALHFGHVAGVFVPADAFARFLRDRIGAENVLFVSGTDCFGSPIEEGHRKAAEAGFSGTITDYVTQNHDAQKRTLDAYNISLDIYEGSGLGQAGKVHAQMSATVLEILHEKGYLQLQSHRQFFDTQLGVFLNGRQVQGFCPVQGCKSEKAYADECDLGHQFAPADLIAPKSMLSGATPELRPVENWYFTLPEFRKPLQTLNAAWVDDETLRPVVTKTTNEFLGEPLIYIKNELEEAYRGVANTLPQHEFVPAEKGK